MRRNVCTNTTIENENKISFPTSEYKIGNTIYVVCTHFNLECNETFEDIIKRLMLKEFEGKQAA